MSGTLTAGDSILGYLLQCPDPKSAVERLRANGFSHELIGDPLVKSCIECIFAAVANGDRPVVQQIANALQAKGDATLMNVREQLDHAVEYTMILDDDRLIERARQLVMQSNQADNVELAAGVVEQLRQGQDATASIELLQANNDFINSSGKRPSALKRHLDACTMAEKLAKIPEEKSFIFKGQQVPRADLTVIPASGGTGKTSLLVQMAMQAALGRAFMIAEGYNGMPVFEPEKPEKVLIVSFEDGEDILLNKIHTVINHFPDLARSRQQVIKTLGENMDIVCSFDLPLGMNTLTGITPNSSEVQPTQLCRELESRIAEKGYTMVMIDPWHYANAITENDNPEVGQATGLMTGICRRTGAAIITWAHTTDANPLRPRGATALVDRSRSVFTMITAEKLKLGSPLMVEKSRFAQDQPEADHNLVRVDQAKNSHGKRDTRFMAFKRKEDGVLVPFFAKRGTSDYEKILDCLEEKQLITAAMIETLLNQSESKVKRTLNKMVEYGQLDEPFKQPGDHRTNWYKLRK